MRPQSRLTPSGLLVTASLIAFPAVSHSEDFYKGKTINFVIGASPGEVFSITAQAISRYMSKRIPGEPTIIFQSMPGAAGIRAENYLYNVASRDGLTIGMSLDNILLNQFLSPGQVKYQADKFNWIGRVDRPTRVLFVHSDSAIKTVEDAKTRDVTVGITAPNTSTQIYPSMANAVLGTRFKEVSGYNGIAALNLALERGEIEAVGANSWTNLRMTQPDWVRDKKIRPLFQVSLARDPALPDTPTLLELCTTDAQRAIVRLLALSELGFYILTPPDVPPERVEILRAAFNGAIAAPEYREDAKKLNIGFVSASGEDMTRTVAEVQSTPTSLVSSFMRAIAFK